MESSWSKSTTFALALAGVGALVFIGWLFDSEDDGKKKKGGGPPSRGRGLPPNMPMTEEEFNKFSPDEQEKIMEYLQQQQEMQENNPIAKLIQEADNLKNKGKLEESVRKYTEAISTMEEDDKMAAEPVVGLTYYKLSLVFRQQEQYDAAVDAMSKAIANLEQNSQTMPEAIDMIADALATLADTYILMGKPEEAEAPFQKSVRILQLKKEFLEKHKPVDDNERTQVKQAIQETEKALQVLSAIGQKLQSHKLPTRTKASLTANSSLESAD